jgi:hypothetical protein
LYEGRAQTIASLSGETMVSSYSSELLASVIKNKDIRSSSSIKYESYDKIVNGFAI